MAFPPKTVDEEKLLTFDFSTEAASGATLANPRLTVVVTKGEDEGADSSDLSIGSLVVDSVAQTVQVLVGGGFVDADSEYQLEMLVDASNGETHRIDKKLPVKAKAALVD